MIISNVQIVRVVCDSLEIVFDATPQRIFVLKNLLMELGINCSNASTSSYTLCADLHSVFYNKLVSLKSII